MSSAWTITALQAVKAALEDDARLATYVDAVRLDGRMRDDVMPDVTRHGILIAPGGIAAQRHTVQQNLETFFYYLKLVIVPWGSPDDEASLLTANTVVDVGTSQVGMLQFREDVANALRGNTLSGFVESTQVEADGLPDLSRVPVAEHDRLFYTATIMGTCEKRVWTDPELRTA